MPITKRLDSFSQYRTDQIGIAVELLGTFADADGDMLITITRDDDGVKVVDHAVASHDETGFYSYTFGADNSVGPNTGKIISAILGAYTVLWEWDLQQKHREFDYHFLITDQQPYFDSLSPDQKGLVDDVYHKVSDGFDSTVGGPYLWELPQASFNLETIARLMIVDAMNYINYASPKAFIPPYQLGMNVNKAFPSDYWGLLEKATAFELYKHLARSYLEIPEPVGVNVAHLDRTRYSQKWLEIAALEKEELDHMLRMLKRDMRFGVKSRSLLLAGGIFPISYLNPARPRWPYVLSRFY